MTNERRPHWNHPSWDGFNHCTCSSCGGIGCDWDDCYNGIVYRPECLPEFLSSSLSDTMKEIIRESVEEAKLLIEMDVDKLLEGI